MTFVTILVIYFILFYFVPWWYLHIMQNCSLVSYSYWLGY